MDKIIDEWLRAKKGLKLLEEIWTVLGPYGYSNDEYTIEKLHEIHTKLREYFNFDDSE